MSIWILDYLKDSNEKEMGNTNLYFFNYQS